MPTRYLKESICTSEQIDALTAFDETVFYRLIVNVDDFGRMDGRLPIIRSKLFPLKDIRDAQIEKALQALSSAELVERYVVCGKPFVRLTGWVRHQSIRAAKSRYPGPEEADETQNEQFADNCMQTYTDSDNFSRNRNRNRNRNRESNICAEPETDSAPQADASPVLITLILNTGEEHPITQQTVDQLSPIYPGVDIMAELRAMKGWCIGHPAKRKTKRGIMAFVTNWLKTAQDEATRKRANGQPVKQYQAGANGVDIQPGENPFRR